MLPRLQKALADRYRVERELGAGGMAMVYLAEDVRHRRPVAIKVLRPELAAVLGSERFLREIEIAARLQHPHILPVHDSGEAEGLLFYVMPYVEGESLAVRIERDGALPPDWTLRLLREVADALSYAHGRGLVHRDIKPGNILLSGQHALIADFGIARAVHGTAGTALTGTGIALGTPAYMAPEQASGDEVDQRADLYALGVVAYEALSGEPPFQGRTAQAVIGAHLSRSPVPLGEARPGLSPTLTAAVMRCLEKHPADRVQSAEELVYLLETAASPSGGSTPVAAPPATSIRQVAIVFAVISLVVLAATYGLMIALGLPSWVFPAAVALLLAGLPVVLTTSRLERQRDPQSAPHRLFNWRRAITGGALAFVALATVVGSYMGMRAFGIGPAGTLVASGRLSQHPRIILADFTDRTGDTTLAAAVTEAFRVDLGQSDAVELLQGRAVDDALARMKRERPSHLTEELAREIATREGVPAFVTGEVNSLGGGWVISARLVDVESGTVLVPLRETAGDSTEIISAVDRLSRKMRAKIGESLRTIRQTPPLDQVTTASLPALRKYTQGTKAMDAGELDRALAFWKEAIAIDTTFAAAYRALYTNLGNLDLDRALAAEAREKAFRFRDRLTERERLWTEGSYYMNIELYDQARTAYLSLLGTDPDSGRILNNLGVVDISDRRPAQALGWYERALAFRPDLPNANFNVVAASLELGRVDRARQVRAQFDSLRPGHLIGSAIEWMIGWSVPQYELVDTALIHVSAMSGTFPEVMGTNGRLWIAGLRGQPSRMQPVLDESERRAASGRQVPEHLRAVAWVATYEAVVLNRPAAAIARVEHSLTKFPLSDLQPADRPYLELARFYAQANQPARARELLADYQRDVPADRRRTSRAEQSLAVAYATLAEGRARQAVGEFLAADVGQCRVCALPGLARAWQAAGNEETALSVLERYLTLPDDDRASVDPLERPGALTRLAELYERRGDSTRAISRSAQFLALWKDAEPVFRPVADRVKDRLRRMTAER